MRKQTHIWLLIGCLGGMLFSCSGGKTPVYEVETVRVHKAGSQKPHVKSTEQFIAIAYADLFGENIRQSELNNLKLAYEALGDLKMIEEMIILNLLARPEIQLPSREKMMEDLPRFVSQTYLKFYNREPNEFEHWRIQQYIEEDSEGTYTPELIYFALMTSNEYRGF